MSVKFKLYQDKRRTSAFSGKWYARTVVSNVVSTEQIAEKIQRNCSMKKSDVTAVLQELSEVFREELLDGNRVIIDGIGSFKVGMSSGPADSSADWSVTKNLRGSHIVFKPETIDTVSAGTRTRTAAALRDIEFEKLGEYSLGDGGDDESQEP